MLVNTAQEGSGGVFPYVGHKQAATPGVLVDKRRKVVNKSSNENQWASLGLFSD